MSGAPARLLVRGARAVLPEACSSGPVTLVAEGGVVAEIRRGGGNARAGEAGVEAVDADGLWLLPGLIDLQVNDISWLSRGLQDPRAHADRIREICEYQVTRGVTGFVLATLAGPVEEILAYLEGMRRVMRRGSAGREAAFLGGLVEGTFMNPEFHGAHNPRWVARPDRALLDRFLETGAVRLVNIAPEVSENAIDLVRHATERGAIVGCGHAKPHAERLREAVAAGLRYIIHLGNGPTGSSLKRFHDGGMLEEALRNDRLTATVIIDGYHVHPQIVRDWIARKEISRIVGVSDAGFATGAPQGRFEVFGIPGAVAEGGEYLFVDRADEPNPRSSDAVSLFGAAADQRRVFENALNLLTTEMEGVYCRRHDAWPFERALWGATAICSANPAALLGCDDRGKLRPGARADLILARIEGSPGSYRVEVERSFLGGR